MQVEAGGLCHTDVSFLHPAIQPRTDNVLQVSMLAGHYVVPADTQDVFTVGHEGCGTLVSLGPTVNPPALHMYASNPPTLKIGMRYAV
jgi:D-arabinose 1-dehydrogenase-like Zn-dependent alcohol dehydrogenase